MNRWLIRQLGLAGAVAIFTVQTVVAGDVTATIEKNASVPVTISSQKNAVGKARLLILDTAPIEGNSNLVSLSGTVTLKFSTRSSEKRIYLGRFFLFGVGDGASESYAFNLDLNPEVNASAWQAVKSGRAMAEVAITPAASDRTKAADVRLPIKASYVELPVE